MSDVLKIVADLLTTTENRLTAILEYFAKVGVWISLNTLIRHLFDEYPLCVLYLCLPITLYNHLIINPETMSI